MKKSFLTIGLGALLSVPVSLAYAEDISYGQVVLRGLDKVTGRLSTMTVNVGEKTTFGALDIYARVCYAHPPEETPENAAFLEIVEKKEEGQLKLFSGWMFSSSPALSAMDHAVYDVWVIKCQGDQVTPPAPEPLFLENPIEIKSVQPKLKLIWDEEKQTVTNVYETDEAEKPVDPESVNAETDMVNSSDAQETESIVIHVEQPQQEQSQPNVVFGQDGENIDPNATQTQEFRLIPIEETAPEEETVTEDGVEGVVLEDNLEEMPEDANADVISHSNPNVQTLSEPSTQISSEIAVVPVQQDSVEPEETTQEPQEEKTLFSEESEAMEKAMFSTDEEFEE